MATIHKLTKDGSTIFPATITDAIVHPSVSKTLTSMIKDYNVSELFPTEGVGGGNTYTLSLAIQVLGTHLRTEEKTGGLKLKFISSTSSNCEEEYYLTKSTWSTSISDWEQKFGVGDVIGDPVGSWTPGTAEAYVDQKIAEQNQWILGQETKIDLNKNLISQEMQARQNRDAELTDLINEGIREGSGVQFDNTPTSGSVNAVTSNGIFQALYDDSGAYNVTLHHPTSGVSGGATYTLALAYAAVPSTVQRGGLTIKFIDSTSLIYSHYRLNTSSWPSTFNESDWTSMNVDSVPTPGSVNLVKSGGVFNIIKIKSNVKDSSTLTTKRYVRYSDGELVTTTTNIDVYSLEIDDYYAGKSVKVVVGANDTVPAAIAFYSTNEPTSLSYNKDASVKMPVKQTANTVVATIPEGCRLIIITNQPSYVARKDVVFEICDANIGDYSKQTRTMVEQTGLALQQEINRSTQKEEELEGRLNSIDLYRNESSKSKFTSVRSRYIIASNGKLQVSPNYFYIYYLQDVDIKKIKTIGVHVGATDAVPAAIAFYSENIDLSSYTETTDLPNFISSVPMKAGVTDYEAKVPDSCKMVVITNRTSVVAEADVSILLQYSKIEDIDERSRINTIKSADLLNQNFLFGNTLCYGHLFINDYLNGKTPVVPPQSLFDVDVTARLGFKYIEANVCVTSDGILIPFHGSGSGESKTFGEQVYDINGNDIANIVISTVTYQWIAENVRYKSSVPSYRVTIPTLEQFLDCAKRHGMSVMMYYTEESYALAKKYYGDNFIAYNGNRNSGFAGYIMNYSGLRTKESIVAKCIEVGTPYMHCFTTTVFNDLKADESLLKDIISSCHELDCLVGIAASYHNPQDIMLFLRCGGDFLASANFVPEFQNGNLATLYGGGIGGFEDFQVTDGSVADGILTLADGGTITTDATETIILGKGSLRVRYKGSLVLTGFGKISSNYTVRFKSPDEYREDWISTYYLNRVPSFLLTSTGQTEIISLKFVASKC